MALIAAFFAWILMAACPAHAEEAEAAVAAGRVPSNAFPVIARKLEQKSNVQRYRAFKDIYEPREPTPFSTDAFTERMHSYEAALAQAARRADHELGHVLARWGRLHGPAAGYGGVLHGVTWPFFSFSQSLGAYASSALLAPAPEASWPEAFAPDPQVHARLLNFLRRNKTEGGMPLSYRVPDGYWETYKPYMNLVDTVLERLLMRYGLSIYDGALWQMALSIAGAPDDAPDVDAHTARLLSGSSGELRDIRASDPEYLYGEERRLMPPQNAYFFRIIADRYLQQDPLLGDGPVADFPNFEQPHHEDWKPITGEQAWAAIIGPLQIAFRKGQGTVAADSSEVRLALSVLPAVEAMQSRIGAIYHVPAGTRGKYPNEISTENNCSMYGALRLLRSVIARSDPDAAARIDRLTAGIERYFTEYAYDADAGVFVQGGFLDERGFHPSQIFAADCQTWAILALGPEWIDRTYGPGTAVRLWENVRFRSEYLDSEGLFRGLGFTDGHGIYSAEWTCGAITAVRRLREFYRASDPARARRLAADIAQMRKGLETFRVSVAPGQDAYLYSNKRYFIQFGWWANPVPSLAATAWVILVDRGFDPFVLGGGPLYGQAPDAADEHVGNK